MKMIMCLTLVPLMLLANGPVLEIGTVVELSPDDAEKLIAAKSVERYSAPKTVSASGTQQSLAPEISDKMTVAALTAIAVDEGVTISDGFTKAEIINAIALIETFCALRFVVKNFRHTDGCIEAAI